MISRVALAAVSLYALLVWPSAACSDELLATSPNGAYRVEVRSEGDSSAPSAPIARPRFVYTLIETETGRAVWARDQERPEAEQGELRAEGYPTRAVLDDAGRVAVLTDTQRFLILDAASGKKVFDAPLPVPGGKETDLLVRCLANGRLMGHMTVGYLLAAGRTRAVNVACFVVRLPWGSRVFLDLQARKFLDPAQVDDALATSADECERQWVLGTLSRFKSAGVPKTKDHQARQEILSAVWLAGVLRIPGAVDSLRQFEKDESFGWTGAGLGVSCRTSELRQLVHLSLRRLEESPRTSSAMLLLGQDANGAQAGEPAPLLSSVRMEDRAARAGEVKVGMTPKELVEAVGPPDCWARGGFEYDMDAASPFTLRVELDERDNRVSKVESLPPAWKEIGPRDWGEAR